MQRIQRKNDRSAGAKCVCTQLNLQLCATKVKERAVLIGTEPSSKKKVFAARSSDRAGTILTHSNLYLVAATRGRRGDLLYTAVQAGTLYAVRFILYTLKDKKHVRGSLLTLIGGDPE